VSKALITLFSGDGDGIRRNQDVFREVNERVAAITAEQHETTSGFLCECGREDCTSSIELGLDEYREIRVNPEHYVAAPGHCVENIDRTVESRESYEIVAQL